MDARREEVLRRVRETFQLDPKVELNIGGNKWTLLFTNAGAKKLLLQTGWNLLKETPGRDKLIDPEFLPLLIWCGLASTHPDVTLQQVDDALDLRHAWYIGNCVQEALTAFMPDMNDLPPAPVKTDEEADATGVDPTKQPVTVGSTTGLQPE